MRGAHEDSTPWTDVHKSSRKRALSPELSPPTVSRHSTLENSFDLPEPEPELPSRQPTKEQTCLTERDVKREREKKEVTVMDMLQIRRNTARLLLSRTRPPWDVEKVCEAW